MKPEATPEAGRLIRIVSGEMSRQELQEKLDLKDKEHFRKKYLKHA
jgi:ATP-dependent DNA helicase RecG